jgi:hypothetical protein
VPRVPEVIPQLLRSLGDEDVSAAELSRQVAQDVVLVAEVIREANSAYYQPITPVKTVEAAIMMLGQNGLRMLLARVAFRPVINMQADGFARRAAPHVWSQSEKCALAASLLAPGLTAGVFESYLMDKGLSGRSAIIALSIIALANIPGTFVWGILGAKFRRKHLLAYIYLIRSIAMAIFISLPVHEMTVYVFSFLLGFVWLATVPLTNGLVSQVFGVRYLTTLFGFVFVGHQVGAFFGMWAGGIVFDATKSYDLLWYGAIGLGLAAAAFHWPINDRQLVRLQPA